MFGLYHFTNLQSSLEPKQYLISCICLHVRRRVRFCTTYFARGLDFLHTDPKTNLFLLLEQKDVYQRFSLNIKHNFLSSFHTSLQALKDDYWILDGTIYSRHTLLNTPACTPVHFSLHFFHTDTHHSTVSNKITTL